MSQTNRIIINLISIHRFIQLKLFEYDEVEIRHFYNGLLK